jgi:hypothetical protein
LYFNKRILQKVRVEQTQSLPKIYVGSAILDVARRHLKRQPRLNLIYTARSRRFFITPPLGKPRVEKQFMQQGLRFTPQEMIFPFILL